MPFGIVACTFSHNLSGNSSIRYLPSGGEAGHWPISCVYFNFNFIIIITNHELKTKKKLTNKNRKGR